MPTKPETDMPFHPGERVVIDYDKAGAFNGKHGAVWGIRWKSRPRGGKTPGWWATVRCDLPKGLKLMECEIHASHLRAE